MWFFLHTYSYNDSLYPALCIRLRLVAALQHGLNFLLGLGLPPARVRGYPASERSTFTDFFLFPPMGSLFHTANVPRSSTLFFCFLHWESYFKQLNLVDFTYSAVLLLYSPTFTGVCAYNPISRFHAYTPLLVDFHLKNCSFAVQSNVHWVFLDEIQFQGFSCGYSANSRLANAVIPLKGLPLLF